MEKILLCTDLLPESRNTIDYTVRLSQKSHSKIILLHAYYLPAPTYDIAFPSIWYFTDEVEKKLQREVAILTAKIRNNIYESDQKPLQCDAVTKYGTPEAEIITEAGKKHASLIIMGSGNVHGLEKLLGNTTTDVVSKSTVPVLIIPHKMEYRDFKKIVYATDLLEEYENVELVGELADYYQSEVTFLHIAKSHHEGEKKKDFSTFKNEISRKFSQRKIKFEILHQEDVVQSLEDYIKQNNIDCLVLKHHNYTFFKNLFHKSTINQMIYHAPIPLLIYP